MRRRIYQLMLSSGVWFMMGSSAIGMCIWFVPPQRQFEPATNIQILVQHEEGVNNLVVQPQFSSTASDFALVMPFPSIPELSEVPDQIFTELEELTNPFQEIDVRTSTLEAFDAEDDLAEESIRVIEQQDIGDYTATTLEANSADALTQWLQENQYEITEDKQAILDSYVLDGSFFVALKVNIEDVAVDENGFLEAGLRPLQFSYESDEVVLPFRLMAGESNLMNLTIYTLAEDLLYIPGAELQFSRRVTASDIREAPSIEDLDPRGQWLARNVIQFDPGEVTQDTTLLSTDEDLIVDPANASGRYDQSIVLNPDQLPEGSGILVSERGEIVYSADEDKDEVISASPANNEAPSFLWILTALLGVSNIGLLWYVTKNSGTHAR